MLRSFLLCPLVLSTVEAKACIPPPPPLALNGESDSAYRGRARAFQDAELDEDRRRVQVVWFDAASSVSLARITRVIELTRVLDHGMSPAARAEAVRLGSFKGDAPTGVTVAMEDVVATTCGIHGGGTAPRASVGDYVVVFENVQPQGTGHVGMMLRDLREPRVIKAINGVVQRARKATAATGNP
jgi:hypothetical protein